MGIIMEALLDSTINVRFKTSLSSSLTVLLLSTQDETPQVTQTK